MRGRLRHWDRTAAARCAVSRMISFLDDKRGDVVLMFGLMAVAVFMFVGAAVDMARWLNARGQTIEAIDAAVLAAGRALQTGASSQDALNLAVSYYRKNTESRSPVYDDSVSFAISADRSTVSAKGAAHIKTMFMGLAAIRTLPLFAESEAPEAQTAQSSAASYNREVAVMLDLSGSMCSPCDKRDAMRAAAADLVDILMRYNGSSPYWSKVAIVPFSSDVRPPPALLSKVIDPAAPASEVVGTKTTGGKKGTTVNVSYTRSPCVAERAGAEKYTGVAPAAGAYATAIYTSDGSCGISTTGTMIPLTLDKAALQAAIANLSTQGSTAGHVGTAWTYYALSPKWNSVWPGTSQASAFNTKGLKKIAVLMTDGEYNITYDSKGLIVGDQYAGASVNGASSADQAVAVCTAMKRDGIDVYTVGFDLGGNQTAINTLKSCASDASMAYNTATGEQLKQAFRDIAIKLTELHLSK